MIPVEEALQIVLDSTSQGSEEEVPLAEALDRFLAQEVRARENIPPTRLSAMDGYVLRSVDAKDGAFQLELVGEIPAGSPSTRPLEAGQAMKIFTGSVLPEGSDTVIMVEKSHLDGSTVTLQGPAPEGQHVRHPGEVVSEGDLVLSPGIRLGPGHVGLLATLGLPRPRVARRPVVGILPTGSELLPVEAELRPGMVRDSNSYALEAQIRRAGAIPKRLGVAVDEKDALEAKVREALEDCDFVLSSGGVSMGDYDFVGEILERIGAKIHFTRVRTKPGKPLTFATHPKALFFGLPGNPVSSTVSFELFVKPALRKWMGARSPLGPRLKVELSHPIQKRGRRRDFQRARVEFRDGRPLARVTGPQGSGIMGSMAEAQVLLVLHEDRDSFAQGEMVEAVPLDEFLETETS